MTQITDTHRVLQDAGITVWAEKNGRLTRLTYKNKNGNVMFVQNVRGVTPATINHYYKKFVRSHR